MKSPSTEQTILVLRPSDLSESVPYADVDINHFARFRGEPEAFHSAVAAIYIDGTRTRFLKDHFGKSGRQPYKASSFTHGCRGVSQTVIDGVLFSTFPADEPMGAAAGTLVCQPWTDEDNERAGAREEDSDAVLSATVSRQDENAKWRMFHDVGVFIPDYHGQ